MEALTLLFIALKLTHYIAWSWWAVLAPEWISLIIVILVFTVGIGAIIKDTK